MAWEQLKEKFINFVTDGGIKLLECIGVFILGIIVIKIFLKISKKLLGKTKIDIVAQRFILNVVKFVFYLLLIVVIAQIIGIPITGFIAILSAAGLAISLALQGSLSNLANGVVIIITKPFKEGDYVSIDGNEGTVKEIKMLHTILLTTDNKLVSIPNKTVVENDIVNYNGRKTRKVVFNFSVAYASDVSTVKKIIYDCIINNEKVNIEPAPFVALKSLDSSSITFVANCWCKSEEYWDVYYEITETVFNELKRNKIEIPYNQLEVRMHNGNEVLPYNKTPLKVREISVENVVEKTDENNTKNLTKKSFWSWKNKKTEKVKEETKKSVETKANDSEVENENLTNEEVEIEKEVSEIVKVPKTKKELKEEKKKLKKLQKEERKKQKNNEK